MFNSKLIRKLAIENQCLRTELDYPRKWNIGSIHEQYGKCVKVTTTYIEQLGLIYVIDEHKIRRTYHFLNEKDSGSSSINEFLTIK